jgi:curved DNA-binding protein CbpA
VKTHYQTLGVTSQAEGVVIEAAYKALIKRYHPDKRGADAGSDDGKAQAINEAWRVLRDPEKRAEYDSTIGLVPAVQPYPRYDAGGERYAEIADDDDRPIWVMLGFVVLAAVVFIVGFRVWLLVHRSGFLTLPPIPASATLAPSSAQTPAAGQDRPVFISPPASAAASASTTDEPRPVRPLAAGESPPGSSGVTAAPAHDP